MKRNSSKKPAVFLDRDGTLIHDTGYLNRLSQIKLFPQTVPALKLLRKAGFYLFVVSNQSGVARGYFRESMVKKTNQAIQALLKSKGAGIDRFFYCPHHPQGKVKSFSKACGCRKPRPGMVKEAAKKFPIDLKKSYVVGDKVDDLLLAQRARLAGGLLVRTGEGRRSEKKMAAQGVKRAMIVPNLLQAAKQILAAKDRA
jgi:D-glycero-D-manno-heptose 1,7-bisphosphate phosphatase